MQTSVGLVSCNGSKVRENNLSVPCRLIPLTFASLITMSKRCPTDQP